MHMETHDEPRQGGYSDRVAAQVRAVLGHRNLTKHELALMLGENDVWLGRRIAAGVRRVPLDLNDLERIARALDVEVADLLPPAAPESGGGRAGGGPSEPRRRALQLVRTGA